MKHSNTYRLVALAMLVVMLVTASCGGAQTTPASEPTAVVEQPKAVEGPTAEAQPKAADQPAPAAGGGSAGGATAWMKRYAGETIVVSWPSLSHFQVAAQLIPQFEEETGIMVETEFIDYVSLHDKQVLEMSKPQGDYDVVAWTIFWKNEYVSKGLLQPLSQYFGNPTLVLPDYDPDDLVKSYLISGSAVGGKKGYLEGIGQAMYGVPFGAETSILAYRKDIFEANNLKVPETYDELLETAKWITENVDGVAGMTSRGSAGHQVVHAWLLHLNPFGGSVFDDNFEPIVNNAAGVAAANALKEIIANSPPGVEAYGFGEEVNAFLQGEAAMFLDAHKIAAQSRDPNQSKVIDKVGFALHPTQATCGSETGGQAMGIPANSQHKEAAFLFVQWMTSKATDKQLAEIGADVVRNSTLADPALQAKYTEYPVLLEQLKCAATDWRPLIPEWGAINAPILGVKLSEFATGQKDAQTALDEAAVLIREEMARAGYYDTTEQRLKKYAGETIVVSWPSLAHFQVAAQLIPQFEEETGIMVETEFIDYVSLHDKQVLEMSKPQGDYDVVAWTIFWKNEYVSKGLLQPLSQYFGNPTLVLPDYDPDDLVKSYLISGSAVGGKKGYLEGIGQAMYGVPFGAETSILAYRKDIFEANNLKVPETYDELLETAKWITENVDGVAGMTSRGSAGHQVVHAWLLHLNPFGGSVFDDNFEPIVNNAAGVAAANALKEIIANSPPGVEAYGFGEEVNAFLQGEAAMFLDAHKIAAQSRDPNQSKVIDKVGFALHPTQATCGSETGGQAMGIPANSQHKEAAFLFVQWMTSKATDKQLAEIGADVVRNSTLADPALQAKYTEYPVLLEQLKCAATDWRPLIPEWGAINAPILGVKLSEFATGQKDAQTALDEAAVLIREEMARAGYYQK